MCIRDSVSGVLLIFCSLAILVMVLLQDSKGRGLSGVIGGGEMMAAEGRSSMPKTLLAKYTKVAAIIFFVLTILVSVFSIYTK